MNNTVKFTLSFIGGAVFGSLVTYFVTKKKCEQQIEEQLAPVRKTFEEYVAKTDKKIADAKAQAEKDALEKTKGEVKKEEEKVLEKKVLDLNYTVPRKKDGPYIIDQGGEEFGGYMAVSLEYYTDGVLLDGTDIIDDAEKHEIVGIDNLALLDERRPLIWVRNDERQVDYEIAYVAEDFYPDEE